VAVLVAWPVSLLFFVFSLGMTSLAVLDYLSYFAAHDPTSAFAIAVLGPMGILGVVIWGVALARGARAGRASRDAGASHKPGTSAGGAVSA
jgi:hypothetical protein